MRDKNSMALALATGLLTATAWAAPVADFPTGYLLGGVSGRSWQSDQAAAKTLKGGESYRVYSATRYLGEVRGSKPTSQGAPCPDTLFLEFKPAPTQARWKSGVIALGGRWNALPRVPRLESTRQPVYRRAVADLLRQKGIKAPVVQIQQLLRVDLDGDGVQEVLINATRHAGYPETPGSISADSKAGEYSAILLRKIVKGRVQTTELAANYFPKAQTFNAPTVFHIAGAFDVDGDGQMEIVLTGRYYEGDSTVIFRANGSSYHDAMESGCGA